MQKEFLTIIRDEQINIHEFFDALPEHSKQHCHSVAELAFNLLCWASEEKLSGFEAPPDDFVREALLYHDIGIALIPERLLNKTEELTSAECRVIQQHALYGGTLLDKYAKSIGCDARQRQMWSLAAEVALSHHERWDGCGYPYGQMSTAILPEARAVAIANTYDSIVRGSRYRMPLPPDYAFLEILQHSSKQFDPQLIQLFRCHHDRITAHTGQEEAL